MGIGGEQRMPALSPDGSRIAFLLQTTAPDKSGIYAMVAGSQSLLQLSANPNDSDPTWSPDGRFIAFLRNLGDGFSIWLVPTLGGQERRIYSGNRTPWEGPVSLSFSRDGQQLAFADWNRETQQSSIEVLSLADSSVRAMTSPPPGYHDSAPAFSPKGTALAFVRWTGPIFVDDIFVLPVAEGEPRQVTFDHQRIFSAPAWTPDEKEILFSSTRAGMKSLWRIPASGGNPRPIAGSGPGADHPSISSSGELAYEYGVENENLWRIDLRDTVHAAGPAKPLLSSKTSNLMPDFSPDGRKIAFESDRSGYEEIWTCNSDGSNPVQITRLERYSGSPRWSPDGRFIAFDYRSQQHTEIYVVEVGVGSPRPMASYANADNVVPNWSRDGRWVYFASNRGGKIFHLWKAPLNGGSAIQVTKNHGFGISESLDGALFYTRLSESGITKVSRGDGSETIVWNGPGPDNWANWFLSENGIYFVDSQPGADPEIKFLEFKSRSLTSVAKLEKPSFYGLTLTPDRKAVVFSQHDRTEHDIVLMKNFY
jgi:Tol biopolymer transport system component